MKKLLILAALISFHTFTFGQGMMLWGNTPATLITSAAFGGPMPPRISPATTYYFGLFIAPYGTPAPLPGFAGINDPNWQNVVSYTMNNSSAAGAGRLQNPGTTIISGYAPGETVSFVIRGWHSSAGADWETARLSVTPFNYGQSELGFFPLGGGALPSWNAFGVVNEPYAKQIGGFVIGVPEPSSMALIGLGAVACFLFRRTTRD